MLLAALGLFLLSVHVSSQVAGADLHVWPGVLACGVLTAARAVPGAWRDTLAPGTHYVLITGALAWAAGAFDVFARAFAALPLVLFWIEVAARRGVVRYDPTTSRFLLTRSSLYGILRVAGALVEARTEVPARIVRLLPLAAASIETVGMRLVGHGDSYTFSVTDRAFASYVILKSGLFVALPYLEDALATPPAYLR